MSWEAVTWASKQRMKLPHEQLILYVVANCADPDGVAFAQWPGREHWWKYLVDRTRLSKSSLFRHINTLIDLGLGARDMIVLADGTRRPIIRLNLLAAFDIEEFEALHSHERDQSHGETGEAEGEEEAGNTSDISDYGDEKTAIVAQSHHETGPTSGNDRHEAIPTSGTGSFPIMGMHKDSSLSCSKDSPPYPPSGGPSAPDWEDFRKAWARPIERVSVARAAWDHVPSAKRGEVITAARGYAAWVGRQVKPPPTMSAQTFIRENSGWAQWLAYAPDGGATASIVNAHPLQSAEGRAIVVLHEIAGLDQFLRGVMIRNGAVNYQRPVTPRIAALAEAPVPAEWVTLTHNQAGAWEELLRDAVTVHVRKHLREGDRAPWPWPPRKDGTLSPEGASPTLTPDDDIEALANEGTR